MSVSYVDTDDLKQMLSAAGTSYLDADLDEAGASASEMIDDICERSFGKSQTEETRYFRTRDPRLLRVDDLLSVSEVLADYTGGETYDTTLTEGTDFVLGPRNAAAHGRPYEHMECIPRSLGFPTGGGYVSVTGVFGWEEPPARVRKAARILAVRLLLRDRQAPFGIIGVGTDNPAEILRTDPEIGPLLQRLVRRAPIRNVRMR